MGKISEIEYHSGYRKRPRSGLFGPLLDMISPIYEPTGFCGFIVKTTDGEVFTSQGGLKWTPRSMPTKNNILPTKQENPR
jgi:hypothetical protein